MLERLRPKLTFANVASATALFLALSTGGVYAANEFTGANIKNETLTGLDVKGRAGTATKKAVNGTLTTNDIAGQAANAGNGTPFKPGTITQWDVKDFSLSNQDVGVLYAVVEADGTLARSSGGVTSSQESTGDYVVDFHRNISSCAYIGTIGLSGAVGTSASGEITVVGAFAVAPNGVFVSTQDSTGAEADLAFHLVVVC
jgi:hypothetical protein